MTAPLACDVVAMHITHPVGTPENPTEPGLFCRACGDYIGDDDVVVYAA